MNTGAELGRGLCYSIFVQNNNEKHSMDVEPL